MLLFVCSPAGQRVGIAVCPLAVCSVVKWGCGVQSLYKTPDHYRVQEMQGFLSQKALTNHQNGLSSFSFAVISVKGDIPRWGRKRFLCCPFFSNILVLSKKIHGRRSSWNTNSSSDLYVFKKMAEVTFQMCRWCLPQDSHPSHLPPPSLLQWLLFTFIIDSVYLVSLLFFAQYILEMLCSFRTTSRLDLWVHPWRVNSTHYHHHPNFLAWMGNFKQPWFYLLFCSYLPESWPPHFNN